MNKWNRTIQKWYRYKRSDEQLDQFFSTHVPHFWKNLTLIEVIEMALKSETAAHTAFEWDYAKFRTFCEKTWKTKILDYRQFRNLQLEQFKLIQETFEVNTVIFPGNIPRNILGNIYAGHNYIFYTSSKQYDGLPLLRPKYKSFKSINLTINGSYNCYLTDPTNEILLTYQEVGRLTFNSVCFTSEKVGILHSVRFYRLILDNCEIQGGSNEKLAECIVSRGQFLREITIRFHDHNRLMTELIKHIIKNIHKMNIYTLKISMRKTEEDLKTLDNLKKATNLKQLSLTIYISKNNFFIPEEMEDSEFLNRLKYLKINYLQIREYKHRIPNWEENDWYF